MKSKILITTAVDYTNDVIHLGHAYEKVLADAIARFERAKRGVQNVYFMTGTDEHGNTNYQASLKKNISPMEHVTDVANKNKEQLDILNISYQRFIRTTDADHKKISAEFFTKAYAAGDIYKSSYEGLYCEGCESYKTITELVDEKCPLHISREIQKYEEENYFFRWSKYTLFLKDLIETNSLLIQPGGKRKEMLAFIEQGIDDIPVSRQKFKLPWGIEVPFDSEQVLYVWFDALINYYTEGSQKGFWDADTEITHFVGKDISRWHTLLWPAMLKSVGYELPSKVYVHGFINLEGQKISKSLGNVIRPTDLVEKYGVDAVRYYLLKHGPITEDSDISMPHLVEVYNSDLANGLGNTVARIAKLAENSGLEFAFSTAEPNIWDGPWAEPLQDCRVDFALQNIWKRLADLDKHINESTPWAITDRGQLETVLSYEIGELRIVAKLIEPFIPDTSKKIQEQFSGPLIKAAAGLFPRIN